jgi:hypothetical protein
MRILGFHFHGTRCRIFGVKSLTHKGLSEMGAKGCAKNTEFNEH